MGEKWVKQEKRIMRKYGLKPQPFSGAGLLFKEDGENEFVLAQLKCTKGKSIAINKKDVLTLIKHSNESHKKPAFFITFMGQFENEITLICARPFDLVDVAKNLKLKGD